MAYLNGKKILFSPHIHFDASGEIEITENGEHDVSQYATANVNVAGGGISATVNMLADLDFVITEVQ